MANSKTISVRVPEDLLSKIDHLAQEKYKSHKGVPNRSLVILDAIDAYCHALPDNAIEANEITPSHIVTIEQFQSLQNIVYSLAEDLNALKSQIITVSDTVIADDSVGKKKECDIKSVDKLENLPIQLSVHQTEATIFNLEDLQVKPQISPIPRPIFAKRLKSLSHLKSSSAGTQLSNMRTKLGEGFWAWITEEDPDNIKWRYQKAKGKQSPGYVPKGDLSEEQASNLLKWISENS